jgi:nucleoside-diphosphate-sugar epimerase
VEGVGLRAAVTGASGLLGRHVVAALRARGGEVVDPAGAEVVFHLAAQTTVPAAREDPVATFEANVALAWRVLAAAPRAVFASSDQVYGPRAPVPTPETAPLDPDGPYAASKAAADLLARQLPGVVVARLANVYGPGDRHESRLVPGTIAAVRAGRRPQIRGDGSAARDMVFAEDAAAALLALAEHGEAGEAYNVGSGESSSVREVVDAVLRVAGSDLEPEVLGATPPGEGGRRSVDVTKIREATGWTAATALEEGLRRTWQA